MNYYTLIYHLIDDYLPQREAYRPQHLKLARQAYASGELILAGALGDPPDRALLIFRSADDSAAQAFAENDPYVQNGLVRRWEVQPWAVVIGDDAASN
ncbi:MAG: YciI-like protein [Chloroflexota bacterium]